MENTSLRCSRSPIVRIEKEAGDSVFQSASAATIFIGCDSIMCYAWLCPFSPNTITDMLPMMAAI